MDAELEKTAAESFSGMVWQRQKPSFFGMEAELYFQWHEC